MQRRELIELVKRHEGLSLKPYKDSVGRLTIGYGRNLDDEGITQEEAEILLECDITRVIVQCTSHIAAFGSLDTARQHVLCSMAYNLGVAGVLKFKNMLTALEARDFAQAAKEMLASKWALQVGVRAEELADMMKSG